MILEDLMQEADIESAEDFRYFEQFSAVMETEFPDLQYDDFAELMLMPQAEALSEMTTSFFDDLLRGVPDDNTELYATIQTVKDTLVTLAEKTHHRGRGFYADELFRFRQWLLAKEAVLCTPEDGTEPLRTSPLEALMLFREEKLAGKRYTYDFSDAMPQGPDEYTLNAMAEAEDDAYAFGDDGLSYDEEQTRDEEDELPIELPSDWDPTTWDPDDPLGLRGPIDPYTDGFVDRYRPVIDGEYDDEETDPQY
ncbi:MAG: hypothetical protein ACI4VM_01825 [Anaerovoracaceae bacterium]